MVLRAKKLFNHLKATMLQYCFTTSSGMFMVAVKSTGTSSCDPLVQEVFFHKNHWFKVLSMLMKIRPGHLIVLNSKHIKYFSKHIKYFSNLYWKRQNLCYGENFIAAPHQVTLREEIFFLFQLSAFFCLFFVCLPLYIK